jgi:hypothetical protein
MRTLLQYLTCSVCLLAGGGVRAQDAVRLDTRVTAASLLAEPPLGEGTGPSGPSIGLLIGGSLASAAGLAAMVPGTLILTNRRSGIPSSDSIGAGVAAISLIAGGATHLLMGVIMIIVGIVKVHRSSGLQPTFVSSSDEPRLSPPTPRPPPLATSLAQIAVF